MIKIIDLIYKTSTSLVRREIINVSLIASAVVSHDAGTMELSMSNGDSIYLSFENLDKRELFLYEIYRVANSSAISMMTELDIVDYVEPVIADEPETAAGDETVVADEVIVEEEAVV